MEYFVTIPASVFENNNLSDSAKLLYGAIVGLCHKEGYCFASNSYLGEKLGKAKRTISSLLSELKDNNLIYYSGENEQRKILLYPTQNSAIPIAENCYHNNIYNNIYNIYTLGKKNKLEFASKEERDEARRMIEELSSSLAVNKESNDLAKFNLEEIVDIWNSIKDTDSLWKTVNKENRGTKIWTELEKVFLIRKREYTQDLFFLGLENYIKEIKSRGKSDYALHRFTLLEFLKQSNGLLKFSQL